MCEPDAVTADPPLAADIAVIARTGTADEVKVIYTCGKRGKALTVAQLFRLREGLIRESLPVFDARSLER